MKASVEIWQNESRHMNIYMNIWTFKCKNYLNIMQYILVSYDILDAKRAFRIYIYIYEW